jgi:hypothetical protein
VGQGVVQGVSFSAGAKRVAVEHVDLADLMSYGVTIFNRGVVPMPRFLTGRDKSRGK